jgi:predicted alpha/beta superfamily hydrolase
MFVVACSSPTSHAPDAASAQPDAAPPASTDAIVRVHYPAGGHAIAIRGSGGGLSWTAGMAMTASGDTFTYTIADLAQTIEWKPLLDDATWARGPNYHLAPGATIDIYPHFTATAGQVVTLDDAFHSTVLANDRPIYAYLPASYGENTDATYPVVYLHDGQNLWAAMPQIAFSGTWNVDSAFDAAAESGTCAGWGAQPLGGTPVTCTGDGDCGTGQTCETFPEAIAIGVANTTDRIHEYTPTSDPGTPGGGGADAYLAMLITELKPSIDSRLRTRPDAASTSLVGSSLGGLVTAYAGLSHADVFSRLGELSPSTWWDSDVIVGDVTNAQSPKPAIVYVDSGAGDADDEADTDQLAAAYIAQGYVDGVSFRHVVQTGASHSETYWAERLPGALQLLLGSRN